MVDTWSCSLFCLRVSFFANFIQRTGVQISIDDMAKGANVHSLYSAFSVRKVC